MHSYPRLSRTKLFYAVIQRLDFVSTNERLGQPGNFCG